MAKKARAVGRPRAISLVVAKKKGGRGKYPPSGESTHAHTQQTMSTDVKSPTTTPEINADEATISLNEDVAFVEPPVSSLVVISGGQTGVDQVALSCAKAVGLETGGIAPVGFATSNGLCPELGTLYGMTELKSRAPLGGQYVERSRLNVEYSNATLVFRAKASPGTDRTIGLCISGRWQPSNLEFTEKTLSMEPSASYRPVLVITEQGCANISQCVSTVCEFLSVHNVTTLNVAGHRLNTSAGVGGPQFIMAVQRVLSATFNALDPSARDGIGDLCQRSRKTRRTAVAKIVD